MDEKYIKKIEQLEKGLDKFNAIKDFLSDEKYQSEIIEFLENNFDAIQQDNVKSYALKLVHIKGFNKAVPFLLATYKSSKDTNSDYKWRIGNALETIGTKDKMYINEIKKMVLDKKHGRTREMLVLALGKSREESVIPTLIKLLDDSEVYGHALDALKSFKRPELSPYFERFLNDKKTWVRNIAKGFVKKNM